MLIPFTADYPGALVVPADSSNYYRPEGHGGVPNAPKGWVLHTPEERADNIEVTPYYFQTPNISASTHYYLDNDGDVYQMVPERCAAIANGVVGKPYPSWADPRVSLNWQSLNVEIEGEARTIESTLIIGGPQWRSLVSLIKHRAAFYRFPTDREHIIGHYQVASDRTDPGLGFPWAALMQELQGGDMFVRMNATAKYAGVVGGWSGKVFAPRAQPYEMAVGADFPPVPAGALMRLDVRIDPTTTGWMAIQDGGGAWAAEMNQL